MLYVLREIIGLETDYYIHSDNQVCHALKNAKVFKSISEIDDFIRQHSHWTSSYKTIVVTEKELFKARLANT